MPSPECRDGAQLVPVIDRGRCEAKADCVRVCPYHVFELRALTPEERAPLGALARLKLWVHGGRQAFVKAPDDCHGCGLCVKACPEHAIKLQAR
jgi:NAD-dependent dihydropyrimidine dehydrogenase PreA subunit